MSASDLPFIKDRRLRWALLLVLASLPLLGWWTYGLFDLDEGFYASVTASMIRHHEWITPTLNGQPWFEKPILIYWFAKPSIMLFGQAFGPRFPSVLATIATYGLVAWFVRRHFGGLAAVLSLFVLASSLLVVAIGRMIMTDPLLLFFFTAAMLTFWESLVGDGRWRLVTAGCLGFAVLAKGPVALILFGLIGAWTWWGSWRARNVGGRGAGAIYAEGAEVSEVRGGGAPISFRGYWAYGILILAAVIASWYVPAYLANGQTFVQDFLIKQNLGRFTGGDQAHTLPFLKSFWFYIPILLLGMFPWIFWLPAAWPRRGETKRSLSVQRPLRNYLAAWAAIVFLFFTVSGAKLPHYVLPCCPPLAILIGVELAERWGGLQRDELGRRLKLVAWWVVGCWILVQVGFEVWYVKSGQSEAHEYARYIAERNKTTHWPVAAYQLPRRDKDLGTGKPKLLETSLPSLSFYLNQDVVETDSFDDLLKGPKPIWIFTRVGRMQDDIAKGATPDFLGHDRRGTYYDVFLLSESKTL